MEPAFRAYLGLAWELLVRETLQRQPIPGVTGRWRRVSRWWGTGVNREPMKVDVVAESVDGKTLLVGEAKLALSRLEAEHALRELKAKAALLPFASDYDRVEVRLFVAKKCPVESISLDWCDTV